MGCLDPESIAAAVEEEARRIEAAKEKDRRISELKQAKAKRTVQTPDAFNLERDAEPPPATDEEDNLGPLRTQFLEGKLDTSRSASSLSSSPSQTAATRTLRRVADTPQGSLWEHRQLPGPPGKATLRGVRDGQKGVSGKAKR